MRGLSRLELGLVLVSLARRDALINPNTYPPYSGSTDADLAAKALQLAIRSSVHTAQLVHKAQLPKHHQCGEVSHGMTLS